MSLKNAENTLAERRIDQVLKKTTGRRTQKHSNFVHTGKELTTQNTCAGVAQMGVKNIKDTKLKFLLTQQTTVLNQEPLHKLPRIYLQEFFKLKYLNSTGYLWYSQLKM